LRNSPVGRDSILTHRDHGDRIRIARFRDPQSARDFLDRTRPAPSATHQAVFPHGSMNFRSFDAVNGLRPPKAARKTRAIDSVKTSEKSGFHEERRRSPPNWHPVPANPNPSRRRRGNSSRPSPKQSGRGEERRRAPRSPFTGRGSVRGLGDCPLHCGSSLGPSS